MAWCSPYRPKTRVTKTVVLPANPNMTTRPYLFFQVVGDLKQPSPLEKWVVHGLVCAVREDGLGPNYKVQVRRIVRLCDDQGNYLTPTYASESGPPIDEVIYPSDYLKPTDSAYSALTSVLQGNARDGLYYNQGGIEVAYHRVVEIGVSIYYHNAPVTCSVEHGYVIALNDLSYTNLGAEGNPFWKVIDIGGYVTAYHLVDTPPAIEPAYSNYWYNTESAIRIRAIAHTDGEPPYGGEEAISKFQPHRSTVYLRGFDRRGAAAAIHSASETGFSVSGVFRDQADFAVLVIYDADDRFGHPRWRYLPDFDLSGLSLQFDFQYSELQPIDSPKYSWIDWASLDAIKSDGATVQVPLFDYATQVGGTYTKAETTFTLNGGTVTAYDRVILFYQNFAWDYIVPNPPGALTLADIAAAIAALINGTSWGGGIPLEAESSGASLTVRCARPGLDGNMIGLYQLNKNSNLYFTPATSKLTGGSSSAIWRIILPFADLGLSSVRKMWLTFAPQLADSSGYNDQEWLAQFINWSLAGVGSALKVAGPGSVRVSSRDRWALFSGSWTREAGWFYRGWARHTNTPGDKVTITYHCGATHDLYIGTSLYTDRGIAQVRLDSDSPTDLDCYLNDEPAVVTRRLVRSSVSAGPHSLEFQLKNTKNPASSGYHLYFDFLEAAIPADVPDPTVYYGTRGVATDWDTEHSYKVPPARLAWSIDRSGLRGDLNHYLGVFFWNQRKRIDGVFPAVTVTFGGSWADADEAFLIIGGITIGKTVFPTDTTATIAKHFKLFINEVFIGIWAQASGAVLTITCRTPIWSFTFSTDKNSASGTIDVSGSLTGGVEGTWEIDPDASQVLNRAARDWHADYFAEIHARAWTAVAAISMELVNPPSGYAALFLNGDPVLTATGFAGLYSTHCAFSDVVLALQKKAFLALAELMNDAGLTPWLQFGEFVWWYFANEAGMAFYDAYTEAAALAALGRDLHHFITPADDPAVNSYADANFLRSQIKAHIDAIRTHVLATYPAAKFELLWPRDVNEPQLNRYVNLPSQYETKSGSGLDRLKIEGLAYGAVQRDLDKVRAAILHLPNWAAPDIIYLMPWFNAGCPWQREFLVAQRERISGISFWAWDHLCLFSWPLPLPIEEAATRTI